MFVHVRVFKSGVQCAFQGFGNGTDGDGHGDRGHGDGHGDRYQRTLEMSMATDSDG